MHLIIHFQLSFILLFSIWRETLQVTHEDQAISCDNASHYYERKFGVCCKRCAPGQYAAKRCTRQSDTQCQPCDNGTYTEQWNYIMKCMRCRPCDHGSGLIEVVHCSPKQKTICACPRGFQCEAYDEKGNCTFCSQTHIPDPPLSDSTTPGRLHWSIITFPIVFIFALAIVLFVLFKRLFLCKIGANIGQQINRRIFGKQFSSPAKHTHEIEPTIPQQEEGKHLPFPIQETEEPQCKETTSLSYSDNWTGPFPAHVATCTLLSGVPS